MSHENRQLSGQKAYRGESNCEHADKRLDGNTCSLVEHARQIQNCRTRELNPTVPNPNGRRGKKRIKEKGPILKRSSMSLEEDKHKDV
jgi:hypothetical protein